MFTSVQKMNDSVVQLKVQQLVKLKGQMFVQMIHIFFLLNYFYFAFVCGTVLPVDCFCFCFLHSLLSFSLLFFIPFFFHGGGGGGGDEFIRPRLNIFSFLTVLYLLLM